MAKIPNGPAKIKIVKRTKDGIEFCFVSFPDKLRGEETDYAYEGGPIANDPIRCGKWDIFSCEFPEVCDWGGRPKFFCPGIDRRMDGDLCLWPDAETELRKIIKAINAFASGRHWRNLKDRVRAYRGKLCPK